MRTTSLPKSSSGLHVTHGVREAFECESSSDDGLEGPYDFMDLRQHVKEDKFPVK